jgi:hypothetical protein
LPQLAQAIETEPQPTVSPTGSPNLVAIAFPTLTPTMMPTSLPTPVNPTPVPPRGISGRVFYQGVAVAAINVQLESCLVGGSCEVLARTATDANGLYNFPYAPTYNGAFGYQITYRNGPDGNNPVDSRYLLYWQEPILLDYDYAQRVEGGSFDIANVLLGAPAEGASRPLPVTFSWESRNVAGDQVQWFLDAPFDLGLCDQPQKGTNTNFVFESLDCTFPPVATNEAIAWYVQVYGPQGGTGKSQIRTVIFQ